MAGTAVATGVTGSVQPRGAAELTWALIMALVRNVPEEAASLRAGGWQVSVGGDLEGRTMGILGFVTRDTYRIFYRDTVENILAWLEGRPVRVMNGWLIPRFGAAVPRGWPSPRFLPESPPKIGETAGRELDKGALIATI